MTSQHDADFAKSAQEGHCCTLAVSTVDDSTLSNRGTANISAPLLLLILVTVWQSAVLYAMQAVSFNDMVRQKMCDAVGKLVWSFTGRVSASHNVKACAHMQQMQHILT